MGFFDRFSAKKADPQPLPGSAPENPASAASAGGVLASLVQARENLEAGALDGAMAIYTEVLEGAGDRADVLVTISGDLGATGHVAQIVELVAPRYDATRHGPATGLNLLQAYLALRQAEAAQHVLDILFALNRPELEDRLYGFSNAIAELIAADGSSLGDEPGASPPPPVAKVALVTISKPIWFYGLEEFSAEILPGKAPRPRRIAFAQLAVIPTAADPADGGTASPATPSMPDPELDGWARALPLWFAETFFFAPHYDALAAVGLLDHPTQGKNTMTFPREWTVDNLRQLVDTSEGGLDYIVTGALQRTGDRREIILRIWEVKKFRERKQFSARWTDATADDELRQLHEQVRMFMEWRPAEGGLPYTPPPSPRAWLGALRSLLTFFLVDKAVLPASALSTIESTWADFCIHAADTPAASLAWLELRARAKKAGLPAPGEEGLLFSSPLIARAGEQLAGPGSE